MIVKNLFVFLMVLSVTSPFLHAQFDRDLEPVVVLGSECSDYLGLSVDGIRVMVFDATDSSWTSIPFQLDDYKPKAGGDIGEKELVWTGNDLVDGLDEIVFMGKDLGDQAPADLWPDDDEAEAKKRYEIKVEDPLSAEFKYAYVYYSTTLVKSGVSYITYNSDTDHVSGNTYTLGHDTDDASGLPDYLTIEGSVVDFLDSWRIRAFIDKLVVKTEYNGNVITLVGSDIYFSEDMNSTFQLVWQGTGVSIGVDAEAYHEQDSLLVKEGPIRLFRRHVIAIRLSNSLLSLEYTARIPIFTVYYPSSVEFTPAFSLDIGEAVDTIETGYVAFSQGLNSNAMMTKFYGTDLIQPGTTSNQDSLINQNPSNTIFQKTLSESDWPGYHWFGVSGQPSQTVDNASILNIVELSGERLAPGDNDPVLYYFDYKSADFEPNGQAVYGTHGLRIYDWSSPPATSFEIDSRFRYYYFAENKSRSQLRTLFDKYILVSSLEITAQDVPDAIPPGLVTDLAISSPTDSSVTLTWTAQGDDGDSGGPAAFFVLRYSDIAPVDLVGNDWTWWNAPTTTNVSGLPKPGEPGTVHTITISDLEKSTTYYFRVNVADDGNPRNVSGLSNTASGTTTPVELSSFEARVTPNREVRLTWITDSETNNLGFSIERRLFSAQQWTEIGFVKGMGTTVSRTSYSFLDTPEQPGTWMYRLKQQDTDGAFEYSRSLTVTVEAPQQFTLYQNYPNPFNPTTRITFQIPQDIEGEMTLVIYDMLGRNVRTLLREQVTPGFYNIEWDGNDDTERPLSSGVYVYHLKAGDFNSMKKMIKLQ